jgi:hypothetical protein
MNSAPAAKDLRSNSELSVDAAEPLPVRRVIIQTLTDKI